MMISPLFTKLAEEVEKQFPPKKKEENGAPPGEEEQATEEEEEGAEEQGEEQVAASGTIDPKAVMDFFAQQGKIDDAAFHSFCEQNGFNVHEAESIAYSMAQKLMQILRGGKGANLDPNTVDPQQLEWGLQIESEHTDCPALQKKITLDHLAESPDYYSNEIFQQELQREHSGQNEQMDPEKTAALLRKVAGCGKKKMKKTGVIEKRSYDVNVKKKKPVRSALNTIGRGMQGIMKNRAPRSPFSKNTFAGNI